MSYRAKTRAVDAGGIISAHRGNYADPTLLGSSIQGIMPVTYTTGSITPSSSYNVAQVLQNK